MSGRPRCREWTPLATQQLRLRSLIQIVGYNIRPPEWCRSQCSFYLTLHQTTMSAPFYTSERISSPHPKWKEIDTETTQRMSSTNVVIRIWCHEIHPSKESQYTSDKPQDTVIQTWGVYFSGLRYIGANLALNFTSDCFKSNTLVFQMHGGYFCSYKSLKLDIIPPENEIEHGSLSSDSSGKTNLSKTLESKFIQHHRAKESRSISPCKYSKKADKEYSKSHSPVEKGFKQNFATLKTSASLNIAKPQKGQRKDAEKRSDPNYIYEHSPDNLDDINCDSLSIHASREELSDSKIDLSETAESYDLRNESDGAPKYRYLALNFLKSEIRPSYNASKLQKLHLLQYSIKKKQEAVQDIKERIYKKSALTNDWSQSDLDVKQKFKSRSQRNLFSPEEEGLKERLLSDFTKNGRIEDDRRPVSNGPRLTLKLNDLLSFKSKPSPFQRAEHVRLIKQLEILRFKRIVLSDERDSKLANIRRLKETQAKLYEENQDLGVELMQIYHTLSRRSEALKEMTASCGALRELAARSHAALLQQRCDLLADLHQIFYIDQKDATTWSICGVPLPICRDESPRTLDPLSDSVSAALAAQATCLSAAFLNQPLRYKIRLLGSASKIVDITPDLPDPNIPLFARGGDATLFRYALFLLNKCIAQLLCGRGLRVADMRPTLANLQRLLITPINLTDTSKLFGTYEWLSENACPRTQSLRSLVASERGRAKHCRQFNRFKDAVDGHSPASAQYLRNHRHSRSVGSYTDDQELPALDTSTTSLMGSEPNIYNTQLAPITSAELLKSHNSDSAISRLSNEIDAGTSGKVIFTLGEESTSEKQKLVKMSSNNDDEMTCASCLDENVKKICLEIKDYCSKTECDKEIHEGFDIAKHIRIAEYMAKSNALNAYNLNIAVHVGESSDMQSDNIDIAEYMANASYGTSAIEEEENIDIAQYLGNASTVRDEDIAEYMASGIHEANIDEHMARASAAHDECSDVAKYMSKASDVQNEYMDIANYMAISNTGIAKYMGTSSVVQDENINLAKYMAKSSDTQNVDCVSGENEDVCDIGCAKTVTDVIVIPSAEAVLDTGFSLETTEENREQNQ